jgi:hypothetical protein
VIDVTGFNDEQNWLDSAGHPHSDQLHLVERYRRLNANTLRFTVTIEDPKAHTRPWSTSLHLSCESGRGDHGILVHGERKRRDTYGRQIEFALRG